MSNKLAEALRELIACKDLHAEESRAPTFSAAAIAMRDDYNRRKPLAWANARAALAAHDAARNVLPHGHTP
jgi:hypothetical protein